MKNKGYQIVCIVVLFVLALTSMVVVVTDKKSQRQASSVSKTSQSTRTSSTSSSQQADLPAVSSSDWELLLVNREHVHAELNPQLAEVSGIPVDARIAENVTKFLAAAQAIDPNEHLISGYRSVAYQETIYNSYIQQEMAADASLSREAAEAKVQTYSQPAGASEHMTGLAIDMSTVNSLNESDPQIASQVQQIAPEYGFVLRFQEGKTESTGVGYEDWHYRYVGVESAKYMMEHQLSLEEYVALLQKNRK
ncbi:D-alanyl-D-alanine carboxypeptidase [Chlamydia trachomatis]|nr:D-alanyl-D-alanine carboxypeptidase [Chlamydia trachomatis]